MVRKQRLLNSFYKWTMACYMCLHVYLVTRPVYVMVISCVCSCVLWMWLFSAPVQWMVAWMCSRLVLMWPVFSRISPSRSLTLYTCPPSLRKRTETGHPPPRGGNLNQILTELLCGYYWKFSSGERMSKIGIKYLTKLPPWLGGAFVFGDTV